MVDLSARRSRTASDTDLDSTALKAFQENLIARILRNAQKANPRSRLQALCSLPLCFVIGCGGGPGSTPGGGRAGSKTQTATSTHPPISTQYRRTDLQYDPNALQFFPPHVTAYDSVHKRFFISNTTLNRIDVFEATQESQIGSIAMPEPLQALILSDGQLALLGSIGGFGIRRREHDQFRNAGHAVQHRLFVALYRSAKRCDCASNRDINSAACAGHHDRHSVLWQRISN